MEGGTRVRLGAPRGDNDADRRAARIRGTVIHTCFQQIEWLDDGPPSDIAACLCRIAYKDFTGTTVKVETERPFAVRDGDRLLVGTIDRLVTICDGNRPIAVEVLDFKTDAIADHDQRALAEKVRFYTPQLQSYCQAVKMMTRCELRQISAKLVSLDAGWVIPIPSSGAE